MIGIIVRSSKDKDSAMWNVMLVRLKVMLKRKQFSFKVNKAKRFVTSDNVDRIMERDISNIKSTKKSGNQFFIIKGLSIEAS